MHFIQRGETGFHVADRKRDLQRKEIVHRLQRRLKEIFQFVDPVVYRIAMKIQLGCSLFQTAVVFYVGL